MLMRTRKRSVQGLSERVAFLRGRAGLSQQVLATRAGISIPRLADAERHGLATTETLMLIARALGLDVDDVAGRRGELGPPPGKVP